MAAGAGGGGSSTLAVKPPPPALAPVPDMSNMRLVDVMNMTEEQRNALVSPVVRPSTLHPNSGK